MTHLILIFLFSLVPTQVESENYFYFEKIDNVAIIYVDGEEVYRTEQVKGNPELQLNISLENFVNEDTKEIYIQLENGHSYNPNIEDKHWEIRYELFLDGQPVDYIWEHADDYRTGIVFDKKYILSEWR
jgi:DNA-binding XRE family transcriptional regulator